MVRRGEWEIQGAKIPRRYDIAVYDKAERLQLVVEVKKHPYEVATSLEKWATRIRRNQVVHSGIPNSVYFLLAIYPAPFYLWGKEDAPEVLPRYSFDVQAELPYLLDSTTIPEHRQQEEAVSSWLTDLIDTSHIFEDAAEKRDWLHDSGLHKAIQGGRIVMQTEQSERREPQAA